MSARLIQVIEVETKRGSGKSDADPIRRVVQYWSPDGTLLAERDAWAEQKATADELMACRCQTPNPSCHQYGLCVGGGVWQ